MVPFIPQHQYLCHMYVPYITKIKDLKLLWKEHFSKLLNSSQLVDKCDRAYDVSNTCDIFTHNEMLTAISHLKTGKAVGNDC